MTRPLLIPVFMPALVVNLLRAEQLKGAPLTEQEVIDVRDQSPCVMVPAGDVKFITAERGYDDLDPDWAWEQWQEVRTDLVNF